MVLVARPEPDGLEELEPRYREVPEKRPRGRPKGSKAKTKTTRSRRGWTVDDPPPRITAFVEWFAYERLVGETQTAYAEREGGPGLPTLNMWMRDPRVQQLLDQALRTSNASPIKVQQVLDMLHRRATRDDDVKAAQLYLQSVDRLVPKRQLDIVFHDARTLSDQELHAELRRAIDLLESQRGVVPELDVIEAEVIEETS